MPESLTRSPSRLAALSSGSGCSFGSDMSLDQLRQHAADRLRVKEHDGSPVHPGADLAGLFEPVVQEAAALDFQVRDRIGEVVQARTPLGEKLAGRGLQIRRVQQLQLRRAGVDQRVLERVEAGPPFQTPPPPA